MKRKRTGSEPVSRPAVSAFAAAKARAAAAKTSSTTITYEESEAQPDATANVSPIEAQQVLSRPPIAGSDDQDHDVAEEILSSQSYLDQGDQDDDGVIPPTYPLFKQKLSTVPAGGVTTLSQRASRTVSYTHLTLPTKRIV